MRRIRRTFIATLVASAVTAATFGAAPSVATDPTATASACTYEVWKITKRENVRCRKAKKVLKGEYGDGEKVPGWSCSNRGDLIPEGKCRKGDTKSFKYAPKSNY